jgi:hypothetical protein
MKHNHSAGGAAFLMTIKQINIAPLELCKLGLINLLQKFRSYGAIIGADYQPFHVNKGGTILEENFQVNNISSGGTIVGID